MTRIFVTGVGVVSALGVGRAALAAGLRAGLGPVTREGDHLVARVAGFDVTQHVEPRLRPRMGRHAQLAVAAARLAVADARLSDADVEGDGTAVVIACNYGGVADERPGRTSPHHHARTAPGMAAAWISMALGARGPGTALTSASAAGSEAIGLAALQLRAGRAHVALAGGAEAPLCAQVLASLGAAGILSSSRGDPAAALRPFDRDRDGTVVGEGAAVLVLETEAHAVARGARPLVELAGFGQAMDAHHPYAMPPDGLAVRAALARALEDAGVSGLEVDLVVAHGTGTRLNDEVEARVMAEVLGRPAVTATKPLTGHLLGAAGAIDAAGCVVAMADGFIPAIANCEQPDVPGEIDFVRGGPREARVRVAACLSHGLGGFSSALVFRAVESPRGFS